MANKSSPLEMYYDPLKEKLDQGEPAIGLYINDPNTVELAAHLGFDWFMLDQMFTSHGWEKTEMLIRTAEAAGITPVVRVQSYPWLGYDPRVPVDVSRNLGIGAKYIMVSNSGLKDIKQSVALAHDYHAKISHIYPFDEYLPYGDEEDEGDEGDEDALNAHIIPQPESKDALDALEETMALPEVKYYFIALGDAGQELTGSDRPDWNDEAIWEYIDRAVQVGKETDTIVGANPSFMRRGENFKYTLQELDDRIVRLHDHGVNMIMAQAAPFYFQVTGGNMLKSLEERL